MKDRMSLRKALWLSVCVFVILILLWSLRLFNVLQSEYDILIRWISTINLILLGVFTGVLISEKRVHVRGMITFLPIFAAGFFAAPFVGVGILMVATRFPFSRGIEPIIFGGSITSYLLLYMGLWFWLKKKGLFTFEKRD